MDLPSPAGEETSSFLPFFTPNRAVAPNMFDLAEPTGTIMFRSLNLPTAIDLIRRLGQVWVCPISLERGIYLIVHDALFLQVYSRIRVARSLYNGSIPSHTCRPASNTHRSPRLFGLPVHRTFQTIRRGDPVHAEGVGRDLSESGRARWWSAEFERDHGTLFGSQNYWQMH